MLPMSCKVSGRDDYRMNRVFQAKRLTSQENKKLAEGHGLSYPPAIIPVFIRLYSIARKEKQKSEQS